MSISLSSSQNNNKAFILLSEKGLKITKNRLNILNLLLSSNLPLSHQDIKKMLPKLDKVTIYRVLDTLCKNKIVHKLETQNRFWLFAVCLCGKNEHCHPHFYCKKCKKTECLNDISLPQWNEFRKGYLIENQEIYLYGLCLNCSKGV
jgi:Fur family ferric uptake transcriptional regulator